MRPLSIQLLLPVAVLAAKDANSEAKREEKRMEAFPFPVDEKVFPNGLRAYVVHYDSPGLVAYYSVVRTGSRNEVEPGKSGFAHFFEHMMFRGTDKLSQDAYNGVIKRWAPTPTPTPPTT
jgi:zinc protease